MPYALGNAFWWNPQAQAFIEKIKNCKNGLILLTGAHGIGKTATLMETVARQT